MRAGDMLVFPTVDMSAEQLAVTLAPYGGGTPAREGGMLAPYVTPRGGEDIMLNDPEPRPDEPQPPTPPPDA